MIKQKPLIKILKDKIKDLNKLVLDYRVEFKKYYSENEYLKFLYQSAVQKINYLDDRLKAIIDDSNKKRMVFISKMDKIIGPSPINHSINIRTEEYELLKNGTGIVTFSEFKSRIRKTEYKGYALFWFRDYGFNGGKVEPVEIREEVSHYLSCPPNFIDHLHHDMYERYLEEVARKQ